METPAAPTRPLLTLLQRLPLLSKTLRDATTETQLAPVYFVGRQSAPGEVWNVISVRVVAAMFVGLGLAACSLGAPAGNNAPDQIGVVPVDRPATPQPCLRDPAAVDDIYANYADPALIAQAIDALPCVDRKVADTYASNPGNDTERLDTVGREMSVLALEFKAETLVADRKTRDQHALYLHHVLTDLCTTLSCGQTGKVSTTDEGKRLDLVRALMPQLSAGIEAELVAEKSEARTVAAKAVNAVVGSVCTQVTCQLK